MHNDRSGDVTEEDIRAYKQLCRAVGKEWADKAFPRMRWAKPYQVGDREYYFLDPRKIRT
jgi:hypothetical protein